jgi:catechol-2,3-dioxygenase
MPGIEGLGHVGIHTEDLMKMRDFYTRVMGLQIADENLERGIVFLSANPDYEHHEFVLTRGRDVPPGSKLVQQISFKVQDPDDLKDFHSRLQAERMTIDRFVSHGNALGLYFFDPEGNRIEVYYKTGFPVPQPRGDALDIEASSEEWLATARAAIPEGRR